MQIWRAAVEPVSSYKIVLEYKLLEKLGRRFDINLMVLTLKKYGEGRKITMQILRVNINK